MKIQIDGTNTLNKGAELMLYAILERLEKHYRDAQVLYVPNTNRNPIPIKTVLAFKERTLLRYSRYPRGILRKLQVSEVFFTSKYANPNTDVVLDAGGFHFSDQWDYPKQYLDLLEQYYRKLHQNGTKIIFLPQAFGPFETEQGQRSVDIIRHVRKSDHRPGRSLLWLFGQGRSR